MLGCLSPPLANDGNAQVPKTLSRAETRREKKTQKQKVKVLRATSTHGHQGIGFSFSGAGFLFPYFAGVGASLVQLRLITSDTHLAGASAGSLIAASITSGLSPEEGFQQCLQLANDCRKNGSKGRLKEALRQHLLATLPPDAHETVRGRTHVAVTQAVPLKRRIVSEWSSREDLVDCLVASCHLPRYSNDSLTSPFRGKAHMDGGVLNFIPAIPVADVMTVGVCCFPAKYMERMPVKSVIKNMSICPDLFEPHEWKYTLRELMDAAFNPGSDAFLRVLYDRGLRDAALWADSMGLVTHHPAADNVLSPKLSPKPAAEQSLEPSPMLINSPFDAVPSSLQFDFAAMSAGDSSMQTAAESASYGYSSMQTDSSRSTQTASAASMQAGGHSSSGPASMQTSDYSGPSSTRSDATTACSPSSTQHHQDGTAHHHHQPTPAHAAWDACNGHAGTVHLEAQAEGRSGGKQPATSASTDSRTSTSTYSNAQSDVSSSSADYSSMHTRLAAPGEAPGSASNPYRQALEVVNSLSSTTSGSEPSQAGGMAPTASGALVSQVMREDRDAAAHAGAVGGGQQ